MNEFLMSFIGLHNYKSASKHDNNFAYAITNKRLIHAQQQALGEVVQSINLDIINDVTKKVPVYFLEQLHSILSKKYLM